MIEFDRKDLEEKKIKDFEYEEEELLEYRPRVYIKFIVLAIALIIGGFAIYSWYFGKFTVSSKDEDIPVIKADKNPIRFKPKDPGGQEFANTDKTVYETITQTKKNKEKNVKLMPQPEEPVAREEISNLLDKKDLSSLDSGAKDSLDIKKEQVDKTKIQSNNNLLNDEQVDLYEEDKDSNKTTQKDSDVIKDEDSSAAEIVKTVTKQGNFYPEIHQEIIQNETKTKNPKQQNIVEKTPKDPIIKDSIITEKKKVNREKNKDKTDISSELEVTTKKETKKTVKTPAENNNSKKGTYYIQLGSFRTTKDVQSEWKHLTQKHKKFLQNLGYKSQKTDLGDRGVFYRLLAGPFKAEADARKICKSLKAQNQDCLLAR